MKKSISLLLVVAFFAGMFVPGMLTTQASAADGNASSDDGMVINKTAKATDDGFEITLEAYATGTKIVSSERKDIPTDIVLVLDQSGSMSNTMGGLAYEKYSSYNYLYPNTNSNLYTNRHNGGNENLWYLKNGTYYSVSVVREETADVYTEQSWYTTNNIYYNNEANLYAKVDGQYVKVNVVRTGEWLKYTYTYKIGQKQIALSEDWNGRPKISGTDDNKLYIREKGYSYTYSYTDGNGTTTTLGTSTGEDTRFTDVDLYYQFTDAGKTRLETLKEAVTSFISAVSTKAKGSDGIAGTSDDINHRIAVVGFASTGDSRSDYTNTELLSTNNVINYRSAQASNYQDALVEVNGTNGSVNSRLTTAVSRLDASGDTYLEYGMDMANKIFEQYSIDSSATRQRVVIVFTDGYPAPASSNDFKYSMANAAISNAYETKNTYKATVYTVGVFNDADPAADITTNFATDDSWKVNGNSLNDEQEKTAANRYMHYVSSNYLSASSLNNGGSLNPKADPFNHGDSYYLVASNSQALNNIFQQIASQIESGGSATTLNASSVIKDIIAPQFSLPENATGANITVETYRCTGKNNTTGEYNWTKNDTAMGATATVDGDKVDVTGFNFSENWVGTETTNGSTTYRGNKLVISFTVKPKDGFLGGNDVYTNTSAGVYENAEATEPVKEFNRPTVNVPIEAVTVTAADKNVYLLGGLTAEQIKSGATVKCGNVSLKLDEDNYGLESWQYEYVDIEITYTDTAGNTGTNLSNLKDDATYTVTAKVSPKTNGSSTTQGTKATEKSNTATGNINVFKPELTVKDSTVYYGDTAPSDYTDNKTGEVWKHGETLSTAVTMIGDKPNLSLTYTPETGKITDGKVNTKSDFAVDVTVKIGDNDVTEKTTFVHTKCNDQETDPTNGKFWLHVKTCTLTVCKAAGTNTTIGNDEYFVFNIKKDGQNYTQVTIQGSGSVEIKGLPVGTYTVEEDASTAWRYTIAYSDSGEATLSAKNIAGSVTVTNTVKNNQWLNFFHRVINTFGVNPNAKQ